MSLFELVFNPHGDDFLLRYTAVRISGHVVTEGVVSPSVVLYDCYIAESPPRLPLTAAKTAEISFRNL